MEPFEKRFTELPPDIKQEVIDFTEFLESKRKIAGNEPLKFDWIGGLKKYKNQYTSLELQKKALEWRD